MLTVAQTGSGHSYKQELNPGLQHEYQGLKYLSHQLPSPRVQVNRKLEWEVEQSSDVMWAAPAVSTTVPKALPLLIFNGFFISTHEKSLLSFAKSSLP